ncbi:serine hydrolase [Anaeromyxobacter sp. K]|uniref:serine hydrolase domain-containing protein n=1 Tax=Anaeromyxobacter sp. (strain K) TaxID=447217 RepID=UPI0026F406D2|nr:serine hydrolase [Anaeromyxobacter sp. K]
MQMPSLSVNPPRSAAHGWPRAVTLLAHAALLASAMSCASAHPPAARPTAAAAASDPGPAARDARSLAAAGHASVICTGVFLQGREPDEVRRDSTYFVVNDGDRDGVDRLDVDRTRREVRVSVRGGPARTARLVEGLGCVTLPEDGRLHLDPARLGAARIARTTAPWPDDLGPAGWAVSREEQDATARAIAPWFDDAAALTAAVVVVHRGRIVAERYANGATADTLLDTSAIGKSVLATLAGRLAQEHALALDAPTGLPEWSRDERRALRPIDLMRMSSGLACTSPFDDDWEESKGYTESQYVYTGGVDAVGYALSRPLAKPPGTEGRYANCDPLALVGLLERVSATRGEPLLAYARRGLYAPLGATRSLTEPDAYGHPLFIGYHFAAARDLARLGVLYARDGVWKGERLLPEAFVRLVSGPAPAWKAPVYGAGFWRFPPGSPMPDDAFSMVGFGGQTVLVVPSLDLVVVRIGHPRGGDAAARIRKAAYPAILAAVRAAR